MKSLFQKNGKSKAREGIRLNRRVFTFIICLFVSIAFWLMMSLSKEYSISISFPVNYTNFPADKIISNHLPETIDIEIKATGFNLLFYKLKQQRETVWLDINDAKAFTTKNHYFLLSNSRIDKITSQFNNEIKVLKINPDTIFLNYNKKITKRVPVIADINIDFDSQYQLTDSIKIEPSSIDISGAADVLEKITYLKTAVVNLKKVATPLILKLGILKSPELKQIELSVTTVQATINVKKFTEASLELPIDVANLPKGYSIKTFPDKVIVKYNVAFDDYLSINSQQFKASVDYSKMESGSNKLKVNLEKFPTNIRSVKLNLDKVEYIIRK
jgi:YbbR domain-containing protein